MSAVAVDPAGGPAQEGTMVLGGCDQPTFVAAPGVSICDIAVDMFVYYPAAG